MDTMFTFILVFILGMIVGSFLNVVILRYKTGLAISKGRSKCFSCSKDLKWFELVPILSFVYLRGRCSSCQSRISIQYPIVELTSGILFAALFTKFEAGAFGLGFFAAYILIFSTLIVIAVYDLRHKIIPDGLVSIFIFLALVIALFNFFHNSYFLTLNSLLNLAAGLILFLPFYLLWKISDGKWIGLGDGKLAIGIGTLLGLGAGLSAIVLSFWIGAVFALIILFFQHVMQNKGLSKGASRLTIKSELPFAPFLILGTIIVFFFPLDIFSLHLFGL